MIIILRNYELVIFFNNNDYNTINKAGVPLTPADTLKAHQDTLEWWEQSLWTLHGPIVLVSHHAPSQHSIKGRYTGEASPAYFTDMTKFIEKHNNIKYWCHGHVHESSSYDIGGCRVVSNPYGYHLYETNKQFSKPYVFEVDNKESLRLVP